MRGINLHEDLGWASVARNGGGGSNMPTTQQTTSAPWSVQQPYLAQGFQQAQNLYTNPANWPQYYPGTTYAGLQTPQQGAINQIEQFGTSGGGPALSAGQNSVVNTLGQGTAMTAPGMQTGQNYLSNLMNTGGSNPWNDPGFQQTVNKTLASVIPAASAGFIGGGRSDSGMASRAVSDAATNAVGSLALGQYNQNRQLGTQAAQIAEQTGLGQQQLLNQAAGLTPGLAQGQLGAMTAGLGAAGLNQQDVQNAINADIARWNYSQTLPENMLSQFMSTIGGNYGGTTGLQQAQNPLGSALGAAGTGAGAINSLFGKQGVFPGALSSAGNWFSNLFGGGGSGSQLLGAAATEL